MENDYNLDYILSNYGVLLLDTSVVMNPFSVYKSQSIPGGTRRVGRLVRQDRVKTTREYISRLVESVESGKPIYLTKGIVDELKRSSICRVRRKYSKVSQRIRERSISIKNLEDLFSLKDRLISILHNNRHIIDTEDDCVYGSFLDRYGYLKERYGISDNDEEMLLAGLVISQRIPCALLSNDMGILRSYHHLKNLLDFSFNELGFFLTMGTFSFKDPDYYFARKRMLNR